jgi:CubicO group peptidase (beta-lactamase class C family)
MPTARACEHPHPAPGHVRTQPRLRLRPALAALALLALITFGAPSAGQPDLAPRALEPEELDAATVQRAAARFELDTIVYQVLTETGVPGAVAAVAANGELIAAEAYGTADVASGRALTLDDPLWLASVTKVPVAIAVLDLVAGERLQLGMPLAELLGADLVPPPPPGDATALTPWHLLTHTSGFGDRLLNTADLGGGPNPPLEHLPMPARVHPAGSGPRYGNAGHHALGLLLERVTGDDVETALRTLVFEPLGLGSARLLRPAPAEYDALTARGHERDLRGALRPVWPPTLLDPSAGQLRLSGRDAAALLVEFTAESPSGPLDNDVRAALLTPAARAHPQAAGTTLGMSEGWMLGHEVVLHAGDLPGLHSLLLLVPSAGLGLFVHINGPDREGGAWSTADGMRDARWLLAERLLEHFVGDAARRRRR